MLFLQDKPQNKVCFKHNIGCISSTPLMRESLNWQDWLVYEHQAVRTLDIFSENIQINYSHLRQHCS